MRSIVLAVAKVLTLVVNATYYAFIVKTLWGWFVVPLGVRAIGMAHAYGLSCLVSMPLIVIVLATSKLTKDEDFWETAVKGFVLETLLLAFGASAYVLT